MTDERKLAEREAWLSIWPPWGKRAKSQTDAAAQTSTQMSPFANTVLQSDAVPLPQTLSSTEANTFTQT